MCPRDLSRSQVEEGKFYSRDLNCGTGIAFFRRKMLLEFMEIQDLKKQLYYCEF